MFGALADEQSYPVYLHCTYGRDRTGVVTALVLLALGATRDEVLREYELTREEGLSTFPDSLSAVLDEVERRGGVNAHLSAVGVPEQALATLRSRLVGPRVR